MAQDMRCDALAGDGWLLASGRHDMSGDDVLEARAGHGPTTGVQKQFMITIPWANCEPGP